MKEDARLKVTLEKHYTKMVKMERTKYRKPYISEALADMANLLGCTKAPEKDLWSCKEVSLDQTSSDDMDADKSSLFSKFTQTKRPAGFFSSEPGEVNNHTGENKNSKVVTI